MPFLCHIDFSCHGQKRTKHRQSWLAVPKGMPGLFLIVAACALSLPKTGYPSLTLTLASKNTFLFSFSLFLAWPQETFSLRFFSQRREKIMLSQQHNTNFIKKWCERLIQTINCLCQALSNITLTCFLFCFVFPNCFQVCQGLADLQKPGAEKLCKSISNPSPWTTLKAELAQFRLWFFVFWGHYWSLWRFTVCAVCLQSCSMGLGRNQCYLSAFPTHVCPIFFWRYESSEVDKKSCQ